MRGEKRSRGEQSRAVHWREEKIRDEKGNELI